MSPRAAALSLLGLAAAGQLALHWRRGGSKAPGEVLAPPRAAVSPAHQREEAMRVARPLAPDERVDVDAADARELERLPGVGPGLARRIVEHRESHGPFGDLTGLDRVPGIGPALLERLGPHLSFSGAPVPDAAEPGMEGRYAGLRLLPGEVPLGALDTPKTPSRKRKAKSR